MGIARRIDRELSARPRIRKRSRPPAARTPSPKCGRGGRSDCDHPDRLILMRLRCAPLRIFEVATPTGIEADQSNEPSPEISARSAIAEARADPKPAGTSQPFAAVSTPSAPESAEPLSVDVLRRKLDAAILAEAWDAVKVIQARIRDAEHAQAHNVVVGDFGRGKR